MRTSKRFSVVALMTLAWLTAVQPARSDASTPPTASIFENQGSWKDETGAEVRLAQWRGKRVVLAFAYTNCKMTCPMTMRRLKKVQSLLDHDAGDAEFLFVTIDPRNDSPERLSRFKRKWEITRPNWHFLSGPLDQTHTLAKSLDYRFEDLDDHILHDNKIYLIEPTGRVRLVFGNVDSEVEAALR